MDKRILWGSAAALGALMLFTLASFGGQLNRPLVTPLGELPLFDLFGVLTAMTVGGAIAGPRFRWFAVALVSVMSLLSIVMLSRSSDLSIVGVIRYSLLATWVSLALAWFGAMLGPYLLTRWQGRRATR